MKHIFVFKMRFDNKIFNKNMLIRHLKKYKNREHFQSINWIALFPLAWNLSNSTATWANVEWVNAEPQVCVDNRGDEGSSVLEDSEDEYYDEDTVNDEVTEHLWWITLEVSRD